MFGSQAPLRKSKYFDLSLWSWLNYYCLKVERFSSALACKVVGVSAHLWYLEAQKRGQKDKETNRQPIIGNPGFEKLTK